MPIEREEMPCDVLFVGAGPANLAGAIHLMDLIEAHNEGVENGSVQGDALDEPMICVIEKASEVGQHQLSGAVVDPIALDELIPDWRNDDAFPVEHFVQREEMVYLTQKGSIKAPWIPPELRNHGKPIVSLGKMCKWMAAIAEEKGVNLFPGFAGSHLLWEGDTCNGVRTGDRGIGKDGTPKDNFEAGMDLTTPVTILGEGPRGHLTRSLIQRRQLDTDSQPMIYEIGVKEILQLPPGSVKEGWVTHTVGYPLDSSTFGGSFIYSMAGDRVCIGLLVALDAADPHMDAHLLLQQLKGHPSIRAKIGTGKVVKYGAKAVTIGGWPSIPQLYTDGAMIVGDAASFLNPMRIKGIHLSMKSGMLAAEAAFQAMLKSDSSEAVLSQYGNSVRDSWIRKDMEPAKNLHPNFQGGFVSGMVKTGIQYFFGPGAQKSFSEDHTHIDKLAKRSPSAWADEKVEFDGEYFVDKLTDVFNSSTSHDEQQPAHLKIIDTEVWRHHVPRGVRQPLHQVLPRTGLQHEAQRSHGPA